jgi:hypothetical protein
MFLLLLIALQLSFIAEKMGASIVVSVPQNPLYILIAFLICLAYDVVIIANALEPKK